MWQNSFVIQICNATKSSRGLGVERLKVWIRGAVQGVGFRPFVYRLATELHLAGWVNNSASGVVIEVDGPPPVLTDFRVRLERERPPRSVIQGIESSRLDAAGYTGFEIRASEDGAKSVLVLPDIATCPDCCADIRDPANRRYRYPFTNCTNCGPRFSIIQALPYDRARTTMAGFAMCPACRAEYEDPTDRRFHAQPNACPVCGPRLALWQRDGAVIATGDEALRETASRIRAGQTVALKGLGGFHLAVDARNGEAVRRLREAKAREEKPFALMFPSLDQIRAECLVSPLEETLLTSPEAPIVLLERHHPGRKASASARSASADSPKPSEGGPALRERVSDLVAPGNPALGVMLPYTPLHHLLLAELDFPIVATSGNLSDEPICTDNLEALARLASLVDVFLVHDRPIARHVDDSIVRVVLERELLLRRARGYAPLPVTVSGAADAVLGGRPAPQEHGVAFRRCECLREPARRGPGDVRGVRGVRAGYRRLRGSLRVSAAAHRLRRAPELPVERLRASNRACRGWKSSTTWRTCSRAWPRTGSTGRRLVWHGTAPVTDWTGPSGAVSSSRWTARPCGGWRRSGPSRFPAETRR